MLPIFSKVFEKIIFNNLYKYFHNNDLLTDRQSGFRPGDSFVNQLISITHEIYKKFECDPSLEARGVFLDKSKAFDKVWHEGLVFKLKTYGIEFKCLKLLQNYLADRQQRVLLNGVTSKWENIYAGVPQGSVLGPLLFLIYINDLPHNVTNSTVKMFADTSTFSTVNCPKNSLLALNSDLKVVNDWALQWKMRFNPDPNKQSKRSYFFSQKN